MIVYFTLIYYIYLGSSKNTYIYLYLFILIYIYLCSSKDLFIYIYIFISANSGTIFSLIHVRLNKYSYISFH